MNSFLPPFRMREKNEREKRKQELDNLQTGTRSPWVAKSLERLFSGTEKKKGGCMPALRSGWGVQYDIFKLIKVFIAKKTLGFFSVILCCETQPLYSRWCPPICTAWFLTAAP